MPLVEQEPLTLPKHLSFFSGVRVTRSLVLCVRIVDSCFSFCTFGHCFNCHFDIGILITFCTFGYCVVCPSLIYGFWLPFVLLAIVLSVLLRYTDSDYLLYFWLLCCLSFLDILILITFCTFGHYVVCPSLIYGFWLPFRYLQSLLTR